MGTGGRDLRADRRRTPSWAWPPFGGRAQYLGKVRDDLLGGCSPTTSAPRASPTRSRLADLGPDHRLLSHPRHARRAADHEHLPRRLGRTSRPADVDRDAIASGRCCTSRATCSIRPRPRRRSATRRGTRTQAGRTVSATLSDSFCVERHRDAFLDLVENHVDLVFANEAEICALYESESFDDALERGPSPRDDRSAHPLGEGLGHRHAGRGHRDPGAPGRRPGRHHGRR